MREIKFRAWDKKHNFMISPEDMYSYNEFISSLGKVIEIEGYSGYSGGGFNENDVTDERIIMQYTGLTDRKGKEIYESDIILSTDKNHFKVIWDELGWAIENKTHRYTGWVPDRTEVIGNIYANPELVSA